VVRAKLGHATEDDPSTRAKFVDVAHLERKGLTDAQACAVTIREPAESISR
jgi:hypothetical protein